MKLFTIGDSLSQGYMSAAAARTDLCYSTLIAEKMGLTDYAYPHWPVGGLPINMEDLLRHLQAQFGSDIDWLEFPLAIQAVLKKMNETEAYYERGLGSIDRPYSPATDYFHNVASSGFDMADAWNVTASQCKGVIKGTKNNFAQTPDEDFYRTAKVVLNPSQKSEFDDFTQLDWYRYHAEREGVENLLLWLGSNNALGTVLKFQIDRTPETEEDLTEYSRQDREQWNLWRPYHFEQEYRELLDRVDATLKVNRAANGKVFIGTIPLVTIIPFAKGFGQKTQVQHRADYSDEMLTSIYYEYYSYFFRNENSKPRKGLLSREEILLIDETIREYNRIIRRLIAEKNRQYSQPKYYLVDTSKVLQDIAYKRNGGQIKYKFPAKFAEYPSFSTKFYGVTRSGEHKHGGFFSLDGIHPTAIGQGIIAYEFLKVMAMAGVVADAALDWDDIFKSDSLYTDPIALMDEFYDHDLLANAAINLVTA